MLAGMWMSGNAQSVAGIEAPREATLFVTIKPESQMNFNVSFNSSSKEKSIIKVKNEIGEVLYEEMVWGSYFKKLNFSLLSDGNYTLEVVKNGAYFSKNLSIQTNREAILAKLK